MNIITVGIDLAKNVFAVHKLNGPGSHGTTLSLAYKKKAAESLAL